ncbi:GGDEF domain-containing protein [Aestuariispira ectoiniformans]|uniref:GGDEF domain-containing protein n=1 Tax=Aestuariispira ectoiniformans TaxID=2775080 RepID=UPI00223BA70F|nr:sensor domain-containing diguanylate cyclase [Aestuariispira ectoiniformans]
MEGENGPTIPADVRAQVADITWNTLIDTQQRMGVILDFMPVGLLIHQEQSIIYANKAASELLGETPELLVGRHILDFIDADDDWEAIEKFHELFEGGDTLKIDAAELISATGDQRYVQIIAGRLPWEGTPLAQVLIQDVTLLKEKEQQLLWMSITDPLTGCYNRAHFVETGNKFLEEAKEGDGDLSVLLLDLDHFKNVNDTRGHAVGDLALKTLAEECRITCAKAVPNLPEEAGLSRLGGEEFAILLPRMDIAAAVDVAERLRRNIARRGIPAGKDIFFITVSIGVSTLQRSDRNIDQMLIRADSALYEAKKLGRNRVVPAHPKYRLPPRGHRIARSREAEAA